MTFLVRGALRMLALAGAVYFTFFVTLGERTLYGHLSRIAATSEARELGTALTGTVQRITRVVSTASDQVRIGNP